MSLQADLWALLKRSRGPLSVPDMAEMLGCRSTAVSDAIKRLKREGCELTWTGCGKAIRYRAVRGAKYVCVGRGNADGSRANLELRNRREHLVKLYKTHGPVPQTALEQCWGWGLGNVHDPLVKRSREGASGANVDAASCGRPLRTPTRAGPQPFVEPTS